MVPTQAQTCHGCDPLISVIISLGLVSLETTYNVLAGIEKNISMTYYNA